MDDEGTDSLEAEQAARSQQVARLHRRAELQRRMLSKQRYEADGSESSASTGRDGSHMAVLPSARRSTAASGPNAAAQESEEALGRHLARAAQRPSAPALLSVQQLPPLGASMLARARNLADASKGLQPLGPLRGKAVKGLNLQAAGGLTVMPRSRSGARLGPGGEQARQ